MQEANLIIEKLLFSKAKEVYSNFKSLPEILIFDNENFYDCPCATYDDAIYKKQLQLKALSILLMKIDAKALINLVNSFYKKSLNYYIGWSIMLTVVLNAIPPVINDMLSDLLIGIETNDFYGLDSVRNDIEKYWLIQNMNNKLQ